MPTTEPCHVNKGINVCQTLGYDMSIFESLHVNHWVMTFQYGITACQTLDHDRLIMEALNVNH